MVVVLLLELVDRLGHLSLPDVSHLHTLVSVDQGLQLLDLLQKGKRGTVRLMPS